MRLRRRNGGQVRIISWDELQRLIYRGINLFSIIRDVTKEFVQSYYPPKTINSRMNENEPLEDFTIYYIPRTHAFGFTSGPLPQGLQEELARG